MFQSLLLIANMIFEVTSMITSFGNSSSHFSGHDPSFAKASKIFEPSLVNTNGEPIKFFMGHKYKK